MKWKSFPQQLPTATMFLFCSFFRSFFFFFLVHQNSWNELFDVGLEWLYLSGWAESLLWGPLGSRVSGERGGDAGMLVPAGCVAAAGCSARGARRAGVRLRGMQGNVRVLRDKGLICWSVFSWFLSIRNIKAEEPDSCPLVLLRALLTACPN